MIKEPCRDLWPEETRSREQVPMMRTRQAYLRNRAVGPCGLSAVRKGVAGRQRPAEALQVVPVMWLNLVRDLVSPSFKSITLC